MSTVQRKVTTNYYALHQSLNVYNSRFTNIRKLNAHLEKEHAINTDTKILEFVKIFLNSLIGKRRKNVTPTRGMLSGVNLQILMASNTGTTIAIVQGHTFHKEQVSVA